VQIRANSRNLWQNQRRKAHNNQWKSAQSVAKKRRKAHKISGSA
jgi:hypothetical protein